MPKVASGSLEDFEIQSMQATNMNCQTTSVTSTLLQKVSQFEHRLKHAENTLKLQDDLFRLKKEESMMSEKIEKQANEQIESKQSDLQNRIIKLESSFEQIQIKVDHEIPKNVAKTAAKCAHKTEKKLVDSLKE